MPSPRSAMYAQGIQALVRAGGRQARYLAGEDASHRVHRTHLRSRHMPVHDPCRLPGRFRHDFDTIEGNDPETVLIRGQSVIAPLHLDRC